MHVDRGNFSSCLQSWSDLRVWLSRVQPVCSEFRVSRLDSLHFNSDFLDHHKVNTDANWFGHIVYTCFYLVGFILVDGADVSAALINQKKKPCHYLFLQFCSTICYFGDCFQHLYNFSDLIILLLPMKASLFSNNDSDN